MKQFGRVALFAAMFGLASAAHANASTIGPNCATCQGSVYTLTNLGLAATDLNTADGSFDTYRIELTIDTSNYVGTGNGIDEVAVKIASSVNAATLESDPGFGNWQLMSGGINANGCSGSGSGFDCGYIVGTATGVMIPGPLLRWVFDVDIASPLLTADGAATIKARYVDGTTKVGALVSENITLTPVPEPGTLALLVLGAAGAVSGRRRS